LQSLATPTGRRFCIGVDGQAAAASRRCLYERFVTIEEAVLLTTLCLIKAEAAGAVEVLTFVKEPFIFRDIPVSKAQETMESLKSKICKVSVCHNNLVERFRTSQNDVSFSHAY
jgi:hypothetical protein